MFENGSLFAWTMLVALGAFHGINPGMGWLFAVALGMQEGRRKALWLALFPLALGHGLAIGLIILAALLLGVAVSAETLKWPAAGFLLALGGYRIFRQRHRHWGGMRVGLAGLTVWSFLMASAHGAGLMVLPFFLTVQSNAAACAAHSQEIGAAGDPYLGLLATLAHSAGYLIVTAFAAWIVFERLGLALLRTAWINLDLIWASALILTGGLTLLM